MKTIEEAVKGILKIWWESTNPAIPMEISVERILRQFESEIRADQDKITRNDCGSEIANVEYHHQGMGCGLEDRNITDRYEAMEHGFDEAIERALEAIMEES